MIQRAGTVELPCILGAGRETEARQRGARICRIPCDQLAVPACRVHRIVPAIQQIGQDVERTGGRGIAGIILRETREGTVGRRIPQPDQHARAPIQRERPGTRVTRCRAVGAGRFAHLARRDEQLAVQHERRSARVARPQGALHVDARVLRGVAAVEGAPQGDVFGRLARRERTKREGHARGRVVTQRVTRE